MALGITGFPDAFPEPGEKVMREHELIYFFLGLAGVVAVVDAVVFKPFSSLEGGSWSGEAHGH